MAEVCPEFRSWAKAGWVDGLCGSAQDQRLLKRPSPGVTVPWHHLMRLWGSSPGPRRVCHSSSWLPAPALLPGAPIPLSEPWGGLALPRAPPAPGTCPLCLLHQWPLCVTRRPQSTKPWDLAPCHLLFSGSFCLWLLYTANTCFLHRESPCPDQAEAGGTGGSLLTRPRPVGLAGLPTAWGPQSW